MSERIIGKGGKNVVDLLTRGNTRNVERAVQASANDLGAIIPGASQYSRFFDAQGLREVIEEFDDLPEDGAVAVFRQDTLGELVDGYHKRPASDEYKFNVTTTIDDLRRSQETGNVEWDSVFEFKASWDENLDMIVELDDMEMQSLEAAFKYNRINDPNAGDARAPIALRFQNGPWEMGAFKDGEWAHSGRVIFRDSEGNTVLEKTVDDFDFPFAQDLRARRDPEKTAEWIKNWSERDAKYNTNYQPLGQPAPRDAMIDKVLELDDDVIDFPRGFASNEDAAGDIFTADELDRLFFDEIEAASRAARAGADATRASEPPDLEAARDQLRKITTWDAVSYDEFDKATKAGILKIPPPYKNQTVLSSEHIEEASRNITQKILHEHPDGLAGGSTTIAFKAEAPSRGTMNSVIGDLQIHVSRRPEDDVLEVQVGWAKAHPSATGKGLGLRMYGAVVEFAKKHGAQLVSDDSLSADAARMYEAMVRRGAVIIDQRITNPDNVTVHFSEWLPGKMTPQFDTLDGTPVITVVKLPDHLPAVMLPIAPLSFQEQQFVENSPYQRILYDVEGDNPYLFRGRQPFKVGVGKGASPSEVAASMLGYNGFKERERRDLKVVASGQHGEGAEEVLYNVLGRSGFDHILHAPDGQVTYWDDKLALARKQEQQEVSK